MKFSYTVYNLILLIILLATPLCYGAEIRYIRIWSSSEKTRVVFDLSSSVDYSVRYVNTPSQLVVDMADSQYQATIPNLDKTPIANLTLNEKEGLVQFVFDLKQPLTYHTFTLEPIGDYSDRLVIDFFLPTETTPKKTLTLLDAVIPNRDIIISIDAGHGGEDPGAIGPHDILEKNLVLKLAQILSLMIDANPGFRSHLVRTGDYYIPLQERTQKAREQKADLFISIHADAFYDAQANGASIYSLSQQKATSESAEYLASRANRSDLIGGVSKVNLQGQSKDIAKILLDLSMVSTLSVNLDLGARLLQKIQTVTRLHKKKVEKANFFVLKSPDVPSLLIEVGFISNPAEAKKINTAHFQKQFARAIFLGIEEYFVANPPPETYLYNKIYGQSATIIVQKNDTLFRLARRHKTTVNKLKTVNRLSSSQIKVGQKLIIPPN